MTASRVSDISAHSNAAYHPLTPHVRAQAFFTSRVTTDSLPCAMTFASIRLALRLDYYVYFIIHTISLFNQWAGYPAHIQSD